MCDIIICFILARKIAQIAKSKGRSAVGWVILFVVLFFGGEISGIVLGALANPSDEPLMIAIPALVGAAIGAVTGFMIVNSLPPVETEDEYWDRQGREYEDEPEDRPRKEFDPADESYREKFDPYRKKDEPESPEDTYRGKGDE